MLDYAANASAHWDAGRLRGSFESRFNRRRSCHDKLLLFIEDELEPEAFWDTVAANLKERRLRLVFVADRIPHELRSIVEFLNEQMQLTEVIAVEIKQYIDPNGRRGQHRPAHHRRNRNGTQNQTAPRRRPPPACNGGALLRANAYDSRSLALAARVLELYEHAKAHGSGKRSGAARCRARQPGWASMRTPRSPTH